MFRDGDGSCVGKTVPECVWWATVLAKMPDEGLDAEETTRSMMGAGRKERSVQVALLLSGESRTG